jgi:hypothetical protein
MPARLAFTKTTAEGLAVEVLDYDDLALLLLTREVPSGVQRGAQLLGVAVREVNSPTLAWYYEYEPIPRHVNLERLYDFVRLNGYTLGVFDQFGNFKAKAA